MTVGAMPLTNGATRPAPAFAVLVEGLRALGYETGALIADAGVTADDLAHPDARVRCEAYGTLFERAQRQRFTPNLALELAWRTPLGAWPLLDYLVATSDTVGAGVHHLSRYLRLTGDPIGVDVREGDDVIRVDLSGLAPFAIEYDTALIARHFRDETDGRFRLQAASFRHRPDDPRAFAEALGCPLAIERDWDGLEIAPAMWQLPLRRRDPILRGLLERQADAILERLPSRTGVSAQVQHALAARVAAGDTSVAAVSRELAMSSRTLQRRLAEEQTNYQKLLDEARKQAAERYLAEGSLAIGEISYLLGYSEPAAFHRAFRRWYGETPEAFRRRRA